jgi:hypothetical protein
MNEYNNNREKNKPLRLSIPAKARQCFLPTTFKGNISRVDILKLLELAIPPFNKIPCE